MMPIEARFKELFASDLRVRFEKIERSKRVYLLLLNIASDIV